MEPSSVGRDEVVRMLRNLKYIFKVLEGIKQLNNTLSFHFVKIPVGEVEKMVWGTEMRK